MKKTLLVCLLFSFITGNTQTILTNKFTSNITHQERNLRIYLPKDYQANTTKKYPLVFCLDGDYVFYATVGQCQPMAFSEVMPEVIIVGIDQNLKPNEKSKNYYRYSDGDYTKEGVLDSTGLMFKQMLFTELIPHLENNYRVGPFKTIVGHSFTGTFVHFLFLEDKSPFSGYISISPYVPGFINDKLVQKSKNLKTKKLFYRNYGSMDLSKHIETVQKSDSLLSLIKNSNFEYRCDSIAGGTHFALVYTDLNAGLKHVFQYYSGLDWKKMDEFGKLDNPINWYEDRLKTKQDFGETNVTPNIDDLYILAYSLSEVSNWEMMKQLGEYTILLFPEELYGYYILGDAYRETKEYDKALEYFRKGYSYLAEDILNKDDFYNSIIEIEDILKNE